MEDISQPTLTQRSSVQGWILLMGCTTEEELAHSLKNIWLMIHLAHICSPELVVAPLNCTKCAFNFCNEGFKYLKRAAVAHAVWSCPVMIFPVACVRVALFIVPYHAWASVTKGEVRGWGGTDSFCLIYTYMNSIEELKFTIQLAACSLTTVYISFQRSIHTQK